MRTRHTITLVSLVIMSVVVISCMAGQEVPALKDVFEDHFLIGGALNRWVITGRNTGAVAIAEKHFNTATAALVKRESDRFAAAEFATNAL